MPQAEEGTLPTVNKDSGWWAIHTLYHHEKLVAEMLTAKSIEVFLPLYDSLRQWRDRRMLLSLPLFPCYLFVRGRPHFRTPIVTTPGVHVILGNGDHPTIVLEAEIQAIRRTIEGPFRVEPHPFLHCGEKVRVKRGSLEGLTGILVRKKNLCRLVLSVEMLAQSVCVEIDAEDVEPDLAAQLADGLRIGPAQAHVAPTTRQQAFAEQTAARC
jgi:transcription antitermination factor NusG